MSTVNSTADALRLVEQLQMFIVERNEQIEAFTEEIACLKLENSQLKQEVEFLKNNNFRTTSPPQTTTTATTKMVTSSRGESTTYETVDVSRDSNHAAAASSSKQHLQRTSSHRRSHRRSDSTNVYQLSADLREKTVECLENKYGGKEIANAAARTIQNHYRRWIMHKSFKRMRAFSGRQHSLTRPPGKHLLKNSAVVFYGPENPVMIVDENDSSENQIPVFTGVDDEDDEPSTKRNAAKEHGETDSINNDASSLDTSSSASSNEIASTAGHLTDEILDAKPVGLKEVDNDKDELDSLGKKHEEDHDVIDHAVDYDIIDDEQVLTVEEKHVDLKDGTSFLVDKIYENTDIIDGSSISAESVYLNEADKFEPTFDRNTHKRQFRIGVNLFNWKPEVGIQYLIDNHLMQGDIKSIADFFRKETMISKQKISEYFGNLRNDFNMQVLYEFAKSFDYVGKEVDEALRQFQSYFKLTGEAQTVEKFLQVFSERYVECNPTVSQNPDTILLLAFALAMLNTDLHNQNVKRRMTADDFLRNLRGTDNGNDLDKEMLTDMYLRIQKNEFATGADHTTQLHQIENSFIGKIPNIAVAHRQFVKLFTIEQVYDPNRREKAHNRLAFLFNDLLMLAKPRGKSGVHGSGHVFSCKASYSLLNKRVAEFSNDNYKFGVLLLGKFDKKVVATFNAKEEKTRRSFVEELDEYIRETSGIENIRIALSKVSQLSWHNTRKNNTSENKEQQQRAKSLMLETHDASSLNDLRNTGTAADDSVVISSSMGDINQPTAEDEIRFEKMMRTTSSSSLDPTLLSSPTSSATRQQPDTPKQTMKRSRSGFLEAIRETILSGMPLETNRSPRATPKSSRSTPQHENKTVYTVEENEDFENENIGKDEKSDIPLSTPVEQVQVSNSPEDSSKAKNSTKRTNSPKDSPKRTLKNYSKRKSVPPPSNSSTLSRASSKKEGKEHRKSMPNSSPDTSAESNALSRPATRSSLFSNWSAKLRKSNNSIVSSSLTSSTQLSSTPESGNFPAQAQTPVAERIQQTALREKRALSNSFTDTRVARQTREKTRLSSQSVKTEKRKSSDV